MAVAGGPLIKDALTIEEVEKEIRGRGGKVSGKQPKPRKRPGHLRIDGRVLIVNDYVVKPDSDESGMLHVRVLGYDEERDESVELGLVMPPDPDDPTEPLWPAEESRA